MSTLALALLSLSLAAAPTASPAGVYRSGKEFITITPTGEEDKYTVQSRDKPHETVTASVHERLRQVLSIESDSWVLVFSDDFKRFTVERASPPFGVLLSTPFVKLSPAELTRSNKEAEKEESLREGKQLLKALFVAERGFFAEYDRFSKSASEIGFQPEPCPDGTRAEAGKGELAGCRFVVRFEVRGEGPNGTFTGTAIGVAPPVKGVKLTISSVDRPGTPAGTIAQSK